MTASSKEKQTHTPGPWLTQIKDDDGTIFVIGYNHGGLVGAALPWPTEVDAGGSERIEANARLIAAAPEMLEALKAGELAIKQMDGLPGFGRVEERDSPMNDVLRSFRAAIAKATGAAS